MTVPKKTTSCEIELKALKDMLAVSVVVPKKTIVQFILDEFFAFISQTLVVFFAATAATNFFADEKSLEEIVNVRIGPHLLKDFLLTFLAILVVIGIVVVAQRVAAESSGLERFLDEFMFEIPRSIYLLGSGATGAVLALAAYLSLHPLADKTPPTTFYLGASMAALASLLYGGFANWVFMRKKFIL